MITWDPTERGFARGKFKDRYDNDCSIQASSLATEECIWLGCNHERYDHLVGPCGARMHLTREHAAELGRILIHFAKTGKLTQ